MRSRFVLPALTIALAGCRSQTPPPLAAAMHRAPPPFLTVAAESLPTSVPIDGSVAARRRAEIATRLTARVTEVTVDVGSPVRAGQVLVRLGGEDVAASRARAVAARDAALAARDEAARQDARMDTLLRQDAVARVQRDQARLALVQSEAQLTAAQTALADAATADGYASLRAPFAGVVAARAIDPGDLATPGVPLVTVDADGPRDAIVAIPVGLAAGVRPGLLIPVVGPDGRTTGLPVRTVAHAADPSTRTVEARISTPPEWRAGVAVTALLPGGRHSGVAIPLSAVVRRGQLTGVRVLVGDAEVLRWIRLGRPLTGSAPDSARVEVLAGLEPGDRVIP